MKEFQFTPLREGRHKDALRKISYALYFNSRPYARGDRDFNESIYRNLDFNSRPYARGDRL